MTGSSLIHPRVQTGAHICRCLPGIRKRETLHQENRLLLLIKNFSTEMKEKCSLHNEKLWNFNMMDDKVLVVKKIRGKVITLKLKKTMFLVNNKCTRSMFFLNTCSDLGWNQGPKISRSKRFHQCCLSTHVLLIWVFLTRCDTSK